MKRFVCLCIAFAMALVPLYTVDVGPFHFSYTYMDRVAGEPLETDAGPADEGFLPIGFSDHGKFAYLTAGVSTATGLFGVALHVIRIDEPSFYKWHPLESSTSFADLSRHQVATDLIDANREQIDAVLDRHDIQPSSGLTFTRLPTRRDAALYHAKIVEAAYIAGSSPGVELPIVEGYTVELWRESDGVSELVSSSRIAALGVLNVSVMGLVASPGGTHGIVVIAEESMSFGTRETLFTVKTVGALISGE